MNEPAEIDLKLPIRGSLGQRRNLDLANLCGPAAPLVAPVNCNCITTDWKFKRKPSPPERALSNYAGRVLGGRRFYLRSNKEAELLLSTATLGVSRLPMRDGFARCTILCKARKMVMRGPPVTQPKTRRIEVRESAPRYTQPRNMPCLFNRSNLRMMIDSEPFDVARSPAAKAIGALSVWVEWSFSESALTVRAAVPVGDCKDLESVRGRSDDSERLRNGRAFTSQSSQLDGSGDTSRAGHPDRCRISATYSRSDSLKILAISQQVPFCCASPQNALATNSFENSEIAFVDAVAADSYSGLENWPPVVDRCRLKRVLNG